MEGKGNRVEKMEKKGKGGGCLGAKKGIWPIKSLIQPSLQILPLGLSLTWIIFGEVGWLYKN